MTISASRRNAIGLAAAVSAATAAKRHGRRAWSAQSASSASAAPSANGNAAERTIPAQTTANVRLDQRALRAPFLPHQHGEGQRRGRDGRDRQQADPERGRERVVEEAVGDEAVAARVPEVVPEREAVIEEHGALVDVRGEIGARRPGPGEQAANIAATPAEIDASRARGEARRIGTDVIGPGNGTRRLPYPLVRQQNRVGKRAGRRDVARAVVDEQRDGDPR